MSDALQELLDAPLFNMPPSYIALHEHVEQGSDEWFAMRRGLLTASEMKLIITPTLKTADNDKSRAHLYEIVAQRINDYTDPTYISDDMLRGQEDEIYASQLYNEKYAPLTRCGFITNIKHGFTIGYSPDALVGDDGLIEIKSRKQKFQTETILHDEVPDDYMVQIQTGLLVSERKWCDFISYCGGMPMFVKRVLPNVEMQDAIVAAAQAFELKVQAKMDEYRERVAFNKFFPTERRVQQDIII